jgi:hypothetical protein
MPVAIGTMEKPIFNGHFTSKRTIVVKRALSFHHAMPNNARVAEAGGGASCEFSAIHERG